MFVLVVNLEVWDYYGMMILIFGYCLCLSIIFLLKWVELGTNGIGGSLDFMTPLILQAVINPRHFFKDMPQSALFPGFV